MSLGRGLGALIPPRIIKKTVDKTLDQTGERILYILTNSIEPNPSQPRKSFGRFEMEELINSIREHGIIQPLIVSPKESKLPTGQAKTPSVSLLEMGRKQEGVKYQLVAGERRWRAAQFLELKTVPALVRSVKKSQQLEISLIENIQRKDLNPMERARGYQRLMDEFNLTQDKAAKRLGKARSSIANTLRLLTLPEVIQDAIEAEKIGEAHAKALLAVDDEQKQKSLLKRVLGVGLTVKETEKLVHGRRVRKSIELDPAILGKERELASFLHTKVKIIKQGKKSKIIIEAYSDEDLNGIIRKITKL